MKAILILLLLAIPVWSKQTAAIPSPAGKFRTTQQDLELRDWIIGIQREAKEAATRADSAETEAAAGRALNAIAQLKLADAEGQLVTIQKSYDAILKERNDAIEHDRKTTKRNGLLTNIVGGELALATLLACLWIGVPRLATPYGLIATCALPVAAFGLVKLIL